MGPCAYWEEAWPVDETSRLLGVACPMHGNGKSEQNGLALWTLYGLGFRIMAWYCGYYI